MRMNYASVLQDIVRKGDVDALRATLLRERARPGHDKKLLHKLVADTVYLGTDKQMPSDEATLRVLELLRGMGADVVQEARVGESLLHRAAGKDNLALVKYLLANGAPVDMPGNHRSQQGATPLVDAIENGNRQIVALLLEKGANPNPVPRRSTTPLHAAIRFVSPSFVRTLLSHGADPNAVDQYGQCPLDVLLEVYGTKAKAHLGRIAQLLLDAGAKPELMTRPDLDPGLKTLLARHQAEHRTQALSAATPAVAVARPRRSL